MCHWDKEFIRRCELEMIIMYMYKRYKDDINVATDPSLAVGIAKDDKSVMRKLKEIADSIDPCLSVTTDCCSNHEDNKTPILDNWTLKSGLIMFHVKVIEYSIHITPKKLLRGK